MFNDIIERIAAYREEASMFEGLNEINDACRTQISASFPSCVNVLCGIAAPIDEKSISFIE